MELVDVSTSASFDVEAYRLTPVLRCAVFALTGGQDRLINAYKVKVGGDGRAIPSISADFALVGHEDNVSTLDVGPAGSYVVSGSWDK